MCGITGGIADRDIAPILLDGLKRLEYRGYDSAGMSVISANGAVQRTRVCGKVKSLEEALERSPLNGHCGIAHTRWATHGKPSEANAHPHMAGDSLAIVHNGIIENYEVLKAACQEKGFSFHSQTDTEVVAYLLSSELEKNKNILEALQGCVLKLHGAYALAVLHKDFPDRLLVARQGSPVVVGLGFGENYIASDILALLPVTQRFIILEEGDIAQVYKDKVDIFDVRGNPVTRPIKEVNLTAAHSDKGAFRHYMQKEIFEQPVALADTLTGRLHQDLLDEQMFGARTKEVLAQVKQVHIVACGTSFHAGLVARYWFENIFRVPTKVEIASEMRYQKQVAHQNTLFVTLSQSGETADTLAALRAVKDNPNYLASLCICNVPESSLVRESDLVFLTHAGPEIGVCSTKAFTTQLVGLLLLGLSVAKNTNSSVDTTELCDAVKLLPQVIEESLKLDAQIKDLAEFFADKEHALFLGRGLLYPIAKEGALKLKEISYIHAESYPAGELKHGPLALVDKEMPVVALACNDHLLDKLRSNLQEVKARHGQLIIFATKDAHLFKETDGIVIELPSINPQLAPILLSIPMQLLAYHVALIKGTDVDQPRNLAKSVTVE